METLPRLQTLNYKSETVNGLLLKPPPTKTRRPQSASDSSTKPLRSSPLAGPALNGQQSLTPSLCHLHPTSIQLFCDSCSSPSLRNKSHSLVTNSIRNSGRTQSLQIPVNLDAGHSSFTRPSAAALQFCETDPFQSPLPQGTRQRPISSSGASSFRRPLPAVEGKVQVEFDPSSSNSSSTSEFAHSRSTFVTRDTSWYTANPYDATPRFSRLGLSSSTVVMPLSPKEHRRMSRNNAKKNSDGTSPTTTTTRRSPITTAPKSPTIPTRISLQSYSLPPQSQTSPQLSRTASSSDTIFQRETPISISTCASTLSLTRSRDSGDSSTSYESLPDSSSPSTLYMSAENDGEAYEGDKGKADEEIGRVLELRGFDGHHDQIHSPDTTVNSDDNDGLDQELASNSIPLEQHSDSQPQPTPNLQPTTNSPFQTLTGRDSQRNKLVRIKLQPVDFDNLRGSFTTGKQTTTTAPKIPTEMSSVGQAELTLQLPKILVPAIPEVVMVVESDDKHKSVPVPPPLPTPALKEKLSMFKTMLKFFSGKSGARKRNE